MQLFVIVIQSEAKNLEYINYIHNYIHFSSWAMSQYLGLMLRIKFSFFSRLQPFNSFSLAMASFISVNDS